MTERISRLREQSISMKPRVDPERAVIVTEAYRNLEQSLPSAVKRAKAFQAICEKKTVYIGQDDLIVGERGSGPKMTSTYPELTCHSVQDLETLRSRPMTSYDVDDSTIEIYRSDIIPYWRGKCIRDRAFASMPEEWLALYEAGAFTEFMEQRAAGHTSLDDLPYRKGLRSIRADVESSRAKVASDDPRRAEKLAELEAMALSCDAAIRLAERHAEKAAQMARSETDRDRAVELLEIAEICRRVPAEAPRPSTRRSRPIGSSISARSPSSTAGTP